MARGDTGILEGTRVLVVGASAGIGRHLARLAIARGATVVVAARRGSVLSELVAEAGGGVAATVDIVDPASRDQLVRTVVEELGAVDLIVHTVGYAALRPLIDVDEELWRTTFEVNVIGLHALVRAFVPHMAPGGIVGVLSSEAVTRPRPGLATYAASKAALEVMLECWQIEHPAIRFSCAAVGATFPTDFGAAFDAELLGPVLDLWQRQGLMQNEFMRPAAVAAVLLDTYTAALAHPGIGIEQIRLRSPSPVAGTLDEALGLDIAD